MVDTFFEHRVNIFWRNLPLNSGHPMIGWEKEKTHECFYLTHFFI